MPVGLIDYFRHYKIIDFEEKPIFVVQKRLLYEKTSIFYEKYDAIKIKQFA